MYKISDKKSISLWNVQGMMKVSLTCPLELTRNRRCFFTLFLLLSDSNLSWQTFRPVTNRIGWNRDKKLCKREHVSTRVRIVVFRNLVFIFFQKNIPSLEYFITNFTWFIFVQKRAIFIFKNPFGFVKPNRCSTLVPTSFLSYISKCYSDVGFLLIRIFPITSTFTRVD